MHQPPPPDDTSAGETHTTERDAARNAARDASQDILADAGHSTQESEFFNPMPPGYRTSRHKYVAVLGTVMSGLGKGIFSSSLAKLLKGIKGKINLIPYNENPNREIKRPSKQRVTAFHDHLVQQGIQCSVRVTRGRDISAACGQLGKA